MSGTWYSAKDILVDLPKSESYYSGDVYAPMKESPKYVDIGVGESLGGGMSNNEKLQRFYLEKKYGKKALDEYLSGKPTTQSKIDQLFNKTIKKPLRYKVQGRDEDVDFGPFLDQPYNKITGLPKLVDKQGEWVRIEYEGGNEGYYGGKGKKRKSKSEPKTTRKVVKSKSKSKSKGKGKGIGTISKKASKIYKAGGRKGKKAWQSALKQAAKK
jgi:hypothetical protein